MDSLPWKRRVRVDLKIKTTTNPPCIPPFSKGEIKSVTLREPQGERVCLLPRPIEVASLHSQ